MKAVIQKVNTAEVSVNKKTVASIDQGLLVLLGITHSDTKEDAEWLAKKILNLRIFNDENGIMNYSIFDKNYQIITVSQFTLYAKTKKGNRPSYLEAAKHEQSEELYKYFIKYLDQIFKKKTLTGIFGANMQVKLCNDGPVTIIIDTKDKY